MRATGGLAIKAVLTCALSVVALALVTACGGGENGAANPGLTPGATLPTRPPATEAPISLTLVPLILTRTPTPTPAPLAACPKGSDRFELKIQESYDKELKVGAETTIKAEATWPGGPRALALVINGPARPEQTNPQAFYARQDGGSPLEASYRVTAADLRRGGSWRVRVINFDTARVVGCLKVTV